MCVVYVACTLLANPTEKTRAQHPARASNKQNLGSVGRRAPPFRNYDDLLVLNCAVIFALKHCYHHNLKINDQ